MDNESNFSFRRRLRSSFVYAVFGFIGFVFNSVLNALIAFGVAIMMIALGLFMYLAVLSLIGFLAYWRYIFLDLSSKEYLQ
ncbi:hypothetical protein C4564_03645 [Candidatus Microgenomates bacterium]|nr:MAG: hypothetical protein C4564_03645 [Candidatus Microgenomates bacterium]